MGLELSANHTYGQGLVMLIVSSLVMQHTLPPHHHPGLSLAHVHRLPFLPPPLVIPSSGSSVPLEELEPHGVVQYLLPCTHIQKSTVPISFVSQIKMASDLQLSLNIKELPWGVVHVVARTWVSATTKRSKSYTPICLIVFDAGHSFQDLFDGCLSGCGGIWRTHLPDGRVLFSICIGAFLRCCCRCLQSSYERSSAVWSIMAYCPTWRWRAYQHHKVLGIKLCSLLCKAWQNWLLCGMILGFRDTSFS